MWLEHRRLHAIPRTDISDMAASSTTRETSTKGDMADSETTPAFDDPLSWPKWKKLYHTAIAAAFAFVVYVLSYLSLYSVLLLTIVIYRTIASSLYIPAIPSIRSEFDVSETVALLPYSLYAFGQAFGPVLAAPVSETFGRRATYVPYMLLFMLFTIGAGFSNNITALCICRYFAGMTGAPALGVGLGTIADIWSPRERAIPTAIMVVTPFLGPSLG